MSENVLIKVGYSLPRLFRSALDWLAGSSGRALISLGYRRPRVGNPGCGNATMLLKTGDRARVDGGAGTVELK